jgi:hypothetical protein
MARSIVALLLVTSFLLGGCAAARRHPRATTVIVSTTIGAVAAGMMSGECIESPDQDCGLGRAATYAAAGAAGGALLGLFISKDMRPVEPGQ